MSRAILESTCPWMTRERVEYSLAESIVLGAETHKGCEVML